MCYYEPSRESQLVFSWVVVFQNVQDILCQSLGKDYWTDDQSPFLNPLFWSMGLKIDLTIDICLKIYSHIFPYSQWNYVFNLFCIFMKHVRI